MLKPYVYLQVLTVSPEKPIAVESGTPISNFVS
jgi:hypothetical protein